MITLYPVFLLVAATTVLSPGPGVVMTLTNALRHGFRGTFGGILGISAGAFAVATLSATGLGVLLATSAAAFTVMKYVGATYLVYLGVRLWRSPAVPIVARTRRAHRLRPALPGGVVAAAHQPEGHLLLSLGLPPVPRPRPPHGPAVRGARPDLQLARGADPLRLCPERATRPELAGLRARRPDDESRRRGDVRVLRRGAGDGEAVSGRRARRAATQWLRRLATSVP